MSAVTMRWQAKGWAFHCVPVRLESRGLSVETLSKCHFTEKGYRAVVIYVTHGTAGQQRYQLDDTSELSPAKFLEVTLQPARAVLQNAKSVHVFSLACGHVYESSANVLALEGLLRSSGLVDVFVGTMSQQTLPAFLVDLIAQSVVSLLGHDQWSYIRLLDMWLRDALAAPHTDLIYMEKGQPSRVFSFAPFRFRPLGMRLPSVLTSCSCADLPTDVTQKAKSQKRWKVKHNGKSGDELKDITLWVSCSRCGQTWTLGRDDMIGHLRHAAGQYAADAPYAVNPTSPK
ncbi:hypothetical protein FRC09_008137 [Ceratobasidium sp. 395]|nr:hypothetical protein FRC09_008137 [Ceratobasidium sp. 395]